MKNKSLSYDLYQIRQAIKKPFTTYQINKAKSEYRKHHTTCEICGLKKQFFRRNCDIHHIVPVHIDRSLACSPSNFITLCRFHHFFVGHHKHWKYENKQVLQESLSLCKIYEEMYKSD